ncbi:hypothetical protein EVJ58_g164 [Rhodofomes roseus]|uniref:Uncharacterized protein n=1 Tax=Rhodofomes roseus TaxID=34475 RepID=A0A4Y9Z7A5_9APHY|nr:hypothetical protein EVJ58_g164 [Rhodofomes roseus]
MPDQQIPVITARADGGAAYDSTAAPVPQPAARRMYSAVRARYDDSAGRACAIWLLPLRSAAAPDVDPEAHWQPPA